MQKNIIIAILMVTIVGLSVSLHREMRFSKTVIHQMPVPIEKQSRLCSDLASQVLWLRRHLEKTLNVLESERDLEPIPVQTPYSLKGEEKYPSEYVRDPDFFVMPYQKPEYRPFTTDPNEFGTEIGFGRAMGKINLNSLSALFSTAETEFLIDNFYQRLQRLEPLIETATK